MEHDWYWGIKHTNADNELELAGDRFIIVNGGQDEFWRRVRAELCPREDVAWMPLHPGKSEPTLKNFLDLLVYTIPKYGVNHNKFMEQAAQVPVFAEFIKNGPDICNAVANPCHREATAPVEPYSDKKRRELAAIVAGTLGLEDDWFE
jgi:hypothetical protein